MVSFDTHFLFSKTKKYHIDVSSANATEHQYFNTLRVKCAFHISFEWSGYCSFVDTDDI